MKNLYLLCLTKCDITYIGPAWKTYLMCSQLCILFSASNCLLTNYLKVYKHSISKERGIYFCFIFYSFLKRIYRVFLNLANHL